MPTKKTGPSTLKGSKRARQITTAVLEALSGEVGTTEAAEQLGVTLSRYYQLETKALAGMLAAVEPRTKGPQNSPDREIKALRAETKTLRKELRRHQSLLRAARRTVGLSTKKTKARTTKGPRRAKRGSRGKTVLQTLRPTDDAEGGGSDGTTKRDGAVGGSSTGQPRGT
jgi:hypothetical protein